MTMKIKPCIIVDRDGVINFDSPNYIKTPDEWIPIPGSLEAIVKLNQAGYLVAMATNQAGPAQGKFSYENSEKIFQKMLGLLKNLGGHFDYIAKCEHHPKDHCNCRKPKPGLLIEISQKLNIPLSHCIFIGDSLKDIEAAQNAGAKPILVLTGNGLETQKKLSNFPSSNLLEIYSDLNSFVSLFLQQNFIKNII